MARCDVHTTSDTPTSPGADLGPNRDDESGGYWPVREVVDILLWLSSITRPDTADDVRTVTRYAHTPTGRL